ncbi:glucose 1-dehydrogenase [Maribius pontilimi]|uniref:Glucose 1-dehydrogenase n=1 Tax=Palleronia pontilimi TaxID=1964209 RepID=A0A934IFV4_9RHOB|nr:glucose 1-dehydrogenase [Palleronia pontilimi]MBJ3762026.1 glucose 1-dehydrogenase [Palleronia pontilimi]
MTDLQQRHALVTGASSGLGRHMAKTLAAHGARVTVAARRVAKLETLVAEIADTGGTAQAIEMDVSAADDIQAGFTAAAKDFGPVAICVNNAGVSHMDRAETLDVDTWDKVIDVNLRGVFLVAQAAARQMIDAGSGGSIVNIASILGDRVAGGVVAYATSKAGVSHMTRALALEWARHDIRVNALAPGYMQTELNDDFFASDAGKALIRRIPQRRLGRLDELDGPLLLLASDAGSFMTGAVLPVDGGHLVATL